MLPVKLELELRDKVMVTLGLEDSVADTVVLSDTAGVTLVLDEMVADRLELELLDIDVDGELDITEPAPTATNAMFVDCIQFVTVAGSVSPTV